MILITGINGFVGKHLARELHVRGYKVAGIGHAEKDIDESIEHIVSKYWQCDITDPDSVSSLELKNIDGIINLAGLASVGPSFDNPDLYMNVNTKVLAVLGEAFYKAKPSGRILAISTGALYDPNQEMPISETSKIIENSSPYAKSKVAMESVAHGFRQQGYDCVIIRPFNHIGPGQAQGFLIPDLISKLKETNKDSSAITAGNLDTVRDYSDVRDIARAYVDLVSIEDLPNDTYNVCSGNGLSGKNILTIICKEMNIDINRLNITVDPRFIRLNDPKIIIGSSDRLKKDTGWNPQISLQQTIKDILAI